jgi:hypothetical protein
VPLAFTMMYLSHIEEDRDISLVLRSDLARIGVDVDVEGNGLLREGRMYQLVREHDTVRERTLEISFLEPGAEAYAFTFG